MDTVEHLIVGGGPAGRRAAQVLAEAGREVLLVEKRPEIGPKVCAGGLTLKATHLPLRGCHARSLLGSTAGRSLVFPTLAGVARCRPARRPMARWFLAG